MKISAYIFSNIGGSDKNDDCADYRLNGDDGLFMLADGLGGLPNGDKASSIITNQLIGLWQNDTEEYASLTDQLAHYIDFANKVLVEKQEELRSKMKSTLVTLCISNGKAACANVGDSRLYYITGGDIRHITRDHSVAYKKFEAGEISYDELNFDEDQSSLLRTMGDKERYLPDISKLTDELHIGDGFLLCSDGVWKYLYRDEIMTDCLKSKTAEEWAKLLLLRIMSRIQPNSDNLTFITVKILR